MRSPRCESSRAASEASRSRSRTTASCCGRTAACAVRTAGQATEAPADIPAEKPAMVNGNGTDEGAAQLALAVVPASGGAEVDTVQLRERISELRGEIRALGPVNLEALDDLSEERERHDFLSVTSRRPRGSRAAAARGDRGSRARDPRALPGDVRAGQHELRRLLRALLRRRPGRTHDRRVRGTRPARPAWTCARSRRASASPRWRCSRAASARSPRWRCCSRCWP